MPPIHAGCRAAVGADQHERKQSPILDVHQRNFSPSSCASAPLPCSCHPGAEIALASSWQLPLQLCGLHRLRSSLLRFGPCGFWGFSPHDRFQKSVVVVIFPVAIKTRVEVKVMWYHKALKSFSACSAKQTQKATDVPSFQTPSAVNSP